MLLKRYISVYENFLNKKQLDKFLRFCKSRNFHAGKVGSNIDNCTTNKEIRDVGLCHLSQRSKSYSEVHWANVLKIVSLNFFNDYIFKHNLQEYNGRITNVLQCDILKYGLSNHYKFHVDALKDENRLLSAIIFLNDDYEGGELVFKNTFDETEEKVEKKAGSIVIWPSNFLFPHAVKPVTKGERFTVVTWAR